jgi:hypothetical protein
MQSRYGCIELAKNRYVKVMDYKDTEVGTCTNKRPVLRYKWVSRHELLELGKKALAPHFANHNFVHGWMYQQQQLDVATFDAETEATVPVDYAATAALNAKYVLTCGA